MKKLIATEHAQILLPSSCISPKKLSCDNSVLISQVRVGNRMNVQLIQLGALSVISLPYTYNFINF